jgi:hypothetical protein
MPDDDEQKSKKPAGIIFLNNANPFISFIFFKILLSNNNVYQHGSQ